MLKTKEQRAETKQADYRLADDFVSASVVHNYKIKDTYQKDAIMRVYSRTTERLVARKPLFGSVESIALMMVVEFRMLSGLFILGVVHEP